MWATNDSAPSCRMLTCGFASQRMGWRHHENQFVEIDNHGMQLRLFGIVGEHAEFGVVAQHIARNMAAERALHHDLDHGMQAPELGQHRQKIKRGEFVGSDCQLAALQFAEFGQRSGGVVAQVQQALGVFLQNASGVGEQAVAGRAVE